MCMCCVVCIYVCAYGMCEFFVWYVVCVYVCVWCLYGLSGVCVCVVCMCLWCVRRMFLYGVYVVHV